MQAKHFVLIGSLVGCLFLSACAGKSNVTPVPTDGAKPGVATFDYKKVAANHPKERVIRREAEMLKSFKERRVEQLEIARNSFASIKNLQYMQQVSQMGYMEADLQTRMAELRNVEHEKLTYMQSKWLKEANGRIAVRKQAIEEEYRLELFNLRLKGENVRLKPAEKDALNKKLEAMKRERERRLADLFKERDAYIREQARPYVEEQGYRIANKNSELKERNLEIQQKLDMQYDDRLKEAPQALARAMELLDEEITRLETRQTKLSSEVGKDIQEVAERIAAKRGLKLSYVKAENSQDITDEVLKEIKLTK